MKPIDSLKAAGAGLLLLALNLALTTLVIFVYAQLFDPGQPQAHYNAMAPRIAAWSAPIGGGLLLFGAGWLLARRKPERNGHLFVFAVWLAYILIDTASALPMGGLKSLLVPAYAIHAVLSLLAGLAGATLARRKDPA